MPGLVSLEELASHLPLLESVCVADELDAITQDAEDGALIFDGEVGFILHHEFFQCPDFEMVVSLDIRCKTVFLSKVLIVFAQLNEPFHIGLRFLEAEPRGSFRSCGGPFGSPFFQV